MKNKNVNDSITTQVQMILSADINGSGRLFGGRLMEWIDIVAAVTARRHSGNNVTTICVDNLTFKSAVHINDIIVLIAKITYVGKTSMEVSVQTYIETEDGEKILVNKAYLVMVALDENDNPVTVPELILETQEDENEWAAGKKRYELRKLRKKEEF